MGQKLEKATGRTRRDSHRDAAQLPQLLAEPWCDVPVFNDEMVQDLKIRIQKYAPPDGSGVENYKLLLIGTVGQGKTSFVNTVYSALHGKIAAPGSAQSPDASIPLMYREFPMHQTKFIFCDTDIMGFMSEETKYVSLEDFKAMLDGRVRNKYVFNVDEPIKESNEKFRKAPELKDKIHCVAVIVKATDVHELKSKAVATKIAEFKLRAQRNDVPVLVILTHVDKVCPILKEKGVGTDILFRSEAVEKVTKAAAETLGLPPGQVIPVKTYHDERTPSDNIDVLALMACEKMLDYAEAFVKQNMLDREEDNTQVKMKNLNTTL